METTLQLVYRTEKGTPFTTSLLVAKVFNRQHKNIMKSVRRLIEQGWNKDFIHVGNTRAKQHFCMTKSGFEAVTATLPNSDAVRKQFIEQFEATLPVPVARPKSHEVALPDIACTIEVHEQDNAQFVDARQLQQFLNPTAEFSAWFKRQVERCDFQEGVEYAINSEKMNGKDSLKLGRKAIEYVFTIDAAKEVCMVDGGQLGRVARRYFIAIEKEFREMVKPTAPAIPQTFAEALRLAATQAEQLEAQSKQLEEQAPKVAFATALEVADQSIHVGELAKLMRQNGVEIGGIRLFKWLRANGFMTRNNQPTQYSLERGLMEMKTSTWENPKTGDLNQAFTTLVTVKGQQYFVNKFIYHIEHQ
jgi:anti-repressor protein